MATTNQNVIDGLPFTDSLSSVIVTLRAGAPTDIVQFGERVVYEFIPYKNRFVVTDNVAVATAPAAAPWRDDSDAATVTDTIALNLTFGRTVTHALAIQDFVSCYIASYSWINPGITGPSNSGSLKLTASDSTSVTLRTPDFGDSDSYEPYRVSRTSRGGDIQIYRDPMWPATEVFSFKFSYLDPAIVDSLLDFLKTYAAQQITLVDHFNRTWHGFILTPAGDVIQEKATTKTAAFKFQVAP